MNGPPTTSEPSYGTIRCTHHTVKPVRFGSNYCPIKVDTHFYCEARPDANWYIGVHRPYGDTTYAWAGPASFRSVNHATR
jgi:hypothetical protein